MCFARVLAGGLLCFTLCSPSLGCSEEPGLPQEGSPCDPYGACDDGLVCIDGFCEVDPCGGVQCEAGEVCVYGGCYARSCEDRDCPAGLICLDGDCVGHACAGVTCDPGYACADGRCYPTDCAGVDCGAGVCVDGECVPRSCVGVTCPEGEACAMGECYPTDCAGVDCGAGVCVDGECVPPSCVGVTCPEGEACALGECYPTDCATPCAPGEVCVHGECVEAACMGVICPDEHTCEAGLCLPSGDCEPGFGEHEDYPGECHDELQVPCDPTDVEPPENASIDDDELVTIVWDDATGWSAPAPCGWSCDEGYVLDEQQPDECVPDPEHVCEPESNDEFCDRRGVECGPETGADNCGEMRTVDCGDCGPGHTCENGACVCAPGDCDSLDLECGSHDDGCGETIDCGECGTGESCEGGICMDILCLIHADRDFLVDVDPVVFYGNPWDLGGTYYWQPWADDVPLTRPGWDWNEDEQMLATDIRSAPDRDYRVAIYWTGTRWLFQSRDSAGTTRDIFSNQNCDETSIPTVGWEPINPQMDFGSMPILSHAP